MSYETYISLCATILMAPHLSPRLGWTFGLLFTVYGALMKLGIA
jgi:hypothetical protein